MTTQQTAPERIFGVSFQQVANLTELRQFSTRNAYCSNASGGILGIVSSENDYTEITIPADWQSLEYLNLSDNKKLRRLTFESSLSNLQQLDVSDSELELLRLPAGFEQLTWLDVSRNKLEQLELEGEFPKLEYVDWSGNQLREVTVSEHLSNLKYLYLNNNQIEQFLVTATLPKLDTLHLRSNQLRNFPTSWLALLPNLGSLYLGENPLPESKKGTADEGYNSNCLGFMKRFHRELQKGHTINNEYKVLLVGNGKVGKSCLVERLVKDEFLSDWDSTHGISLEQLDDKKKCPYVLNLWDFGGQDIYHATHRMFMQSNAIYLVLWDVDSLQQRFTEREEYGENRQYNNYSLGYWLDYVDTQGGKSPVLVVKTKMLDDPLQREHPDLSALRAKFYPSSFLSFHAHHLDSKEPDWNKNGFKLLLNFIETDISNLERKEKLPTHWAKLRQRIRELQQKKGQEERKTMSVQEYQELAKKLGVEDPMGTLQNWLVKTGVVFYRSGLFNDEIILDQAWAIKAVYTLFNRDEGYYHKICQNKGRFTGKELARFWQKYATSEAERELFVSFMLSCELCFQVLPPEAKEERHYSIAFEEREYIAPQLLSPEMPSSVRVIEQSWTNYYTGKMLYVRYQHQFLHEGILQRFIVRTQYLAQVDDIWKEGILLQENGVFALIKTEDKEIRIKVPEAGKALLDKIRNLLDELQSDKVKELVSVDGEKFVELERLRSWKKGYIPTEDGNDIVSTKELAVFLQRDEKNTFADLRQQKAELPERLIEKSLLNQPDMNSIEQLIGKGRLKEAIEETLKTAPTSARAEVLALQQRFNNLERDRRLGILSHAEENLERNKIVRIVLELYLEINNTAASDSASQPSTPSKEATKILFLAANPTNESRIQTDREHRMLKEQLQRGRKRENFLFLPPQFAVTINELVRALNDKPQIIHFSGHGEANGIIITTDDNRSQLMPLPALMRLFRPLRGVSELVILNACYSAEQAKVISEFGMYVVGNNIPIEDAAAISFSQGFYNGLGEGKSFEDAYNDAMTVVLTQNPSAADVIEVWKDGKKLEI